MGGPFGPGVMSLLDDLGGRAPWTRLRDELGLSPSSLNNHLGKLESGDYVAQEKCFSGNRPRTDVVLADRGREAIDDFHRRISLYVGGKGAGSAASQRSNNLTHESPAPDPDTSDGP